MIKKIIIIFMICIFTYIGILITDNNIKQQEIENIEAYKTICEEKEELIKVKKEIAKEEQKQNNKIYARVTAYAPHDNKSGMCSSGDPNTTSIGLTPSRNIVAVDPSRIPYGTKLRIPGYGEVIAGDTGGALRDYDGIAIDVYMLTHEEAIKWGKKYMEVEIIE